MIWDWAFAFEILPLARAGGGRHHRGDRSLGFLIAATLGLASPASPHRLARDRAGRSRSLVELIRSTPLLIQIFFLYFVFRSGASSSTPSPPASLAHRHPLRRLLLGGLPRRLRERPARPVGGLDRAQPLGLDAPSATSSSRRRSRRSCRRSATISSPSSRRRRSSRRSPSLELMQTAKIIGSRDLPLHRADHPGRRLLPGDEPVSAAVHPRRLEAPR